MANRSPKSRGLDPERVIRVKLVQPRLVHSSTRTFVIGTSCVLSLEGPGTIAIWEGDRLGISRR